MRKIVVVENVSLDGVMQAPGRADEDPRGGFQHGGWSGPYNDAVKGQAMAGGMSEAGPLLFGRRTYEDFFKVWPKRKDNPFSPVLDAAEKFVVSRTIKTPLPWQNSTLLDGDAVETVARVKAQPGKNIVVLGSGELVRSLMPHGLIDEYVLLIHPLMLGSGRRLFPEEGSYARRCVTHSVTTTTGVVIAAYAPADGAAQEHAR